MADETPKFKPSRRRMFECEECGELFVDEESLQGHLLTHFPERAAAHGKPGGAPSASGPVTQTSAGPATETRKKFESPLRKRLLRERAEDDEDKPFEPQPLSAERRESEGGEPRGLILPRGPTLGERIAQFSSEFTDFLGGLISSGHRATSDFTRESVVPAGAAFLRLAVALVLVVGVLLVGIGVGRLVSPLVRHGGGPSPPPGASPSGTPVILDGARLSPQEVVQDFYRAIDERQYTRAYGHLSPAWKRELPFALFERGYSATQAVKCAVLDTRALSSGEVQILIRLEVLERGRRLAYTGHHIGTLTPEGWKLDSGALGP